MTIVNRRNAILGWSVWQVGKMTAKRKAKQTLETDNGKRPGKGAALAALAAAGGAVLIWRRRSGSDSDS
jgi:hypothetical protein